jgi:hypothetical protein
MVCAAMRINLESSVFNERSTNREAAVASTIIDYSLDPFPALTDLSPNFGDDGRRSVNLTAIQEKGYRRIGTPSVSEKMKFRVIVGLKRYIRHELLG